MVNKRRLVATIKKLIRINSENPPGNELEIALWVKSYLKRLGLDVRLYEFAPKRPNVIGILKGRERGRGLLLSPHLDTVPAGRGWRVDPFKGIIRGGRIYGRGATDCKGNLAAGLEAVASVVEDGFLPRRDIIFAATADEECGSRLGIIPLIERNILKPRSALILDANEFDIIVAQKGLIHFKIKVLGKKAHGAYPWRGINAIEDSAEIIHELKKLTFRFKPHPLLRAPTINIGTIRGGDKVNIVADYCDFSVDLRFLPGMDPKAVLSRIKKLIARKSKRYKIEIEGIQDPYEADRRSGLTAVLAKTVKRHGRKPRIKGSEGATVITFFKKKGIPAVGFGFGSKAQAHTANEFAKIDDLFAGAKVLADFIKSF